MTTVYENNVLAHIAAHRDKGETAAVEGHMKAPVHRAIVEAAARVYGETGEEGGSENAVGDHQMPPDASNEETGEEGG